MKKAKRILAVLLAMCMLSVCMPSVYAAPMTVQEVFSKNTAPFVSEKEGNMAFCMDATYSSTEADGRYVDVVLSVENNSGFSSFDVDVLYDSDVLKFVGITKGDYIGTIAPVDERAYEGTVAVVGYNDFNYTEDGNLATIRFDVSEDVLAETAVDFVATYAIGDVCDETMETVAPENNTACTATIAAAELELTANPDPARDGETIAFAANVSAVSTENGNTYVLMSDVTPDSISDSKGILTIAEDKKSAIARAAGVTTVKATYKSLSATKLVTVNQSTTPIFHMDATYVSREDTGRYIDVALSVENNSGFSSFDVDVLYDNDVLKFVGITKGNYIGTIAPVDERAYEGTVAVVGYNDFNYTEDGILATIRFDVSEDVLAETVVDFVATYAIGDVCDENMATVVPENNTQCTATIAAATLELIANPTAIAMNDTTAFITNVRVSATEDNSTYVFASDVIPDAVRESAGILLLADDQKSAVGIAVGDTTVTAEYKGLTATANVNVFATISAIEVSADRTEIDLGETVNLSAKAIYSDGTEQDIEAVYTVDANGSVEGNVFTSTQGGVATITASYGEFSDTVTITIAEIITAIKVSADRTEIDLGETVNLSAKAIYSDGSEQDIEATYTVDANGSVEGNVFTSTQGGTATITASYGEFSDTVTITIAEIITAIKVSADRTEIDLGETVNLSAKAIYSDGTEQDIEATYTVDSNGSVEGNVFTSTQGGTATITASYGEFSDTVTITIAEIITAIEVIADKTEIDLGEAVTLSAKAIYSDGTAQDIEAIYTVDANGGVEGNVFTSTQGGTATITASYGEFSDTVTITIAEIITAIEVIADKTEIDLGEAVTLSAKAIYSDGTAQDIEAIYTVDANGSVEGNVFTSTQGGTATITASYGEFSDTVTITIAEIITAIEVIADKTEIDLGEAVTLSAKAIYSDGTEQDIEATYTVDSNGSVEGNVFTSTQGGTATITATYGEFTDTVTITIAEIIMAIEVSVDKNSLYVGETATLSAKAIYSDGTEQDIEAIYTVDANGSIEDHVFTASAGGTAIVTTVYGEFTDTVNITVTEIKAIGIKAFADQTELEIGETANITAVVSYNNGTTETVTDGLEISASPSDAVSIYNHTVTATKAGTVTVTVSYDDVSDAVVLTVNAPVQTVVRGDVNCDGSVRMNDLVLLLSYLSSGTELTAQGMLNADVNYDNSVRMNDLVGLLSFLSTGSWPF